MTKDTFTITAINNTTGVVTATFSVDGKSQKIGGLPLGDKDALTDALNDYAIAYAAGLDVQTPDPVPAEVTALVGKPQTVVVEEAAPADAKIG